MSILALCDIAIFVFDYGMKILYKVMGWFLKKSDQEAYICRGFAKDTLIVNNFNIRNAIFKYVHQLKPG